MGGRGRARAVTLFTIPHCPIHQDDGEKEEETEEKGTAGEKEEAEAEQMEAEENGEKEAVENKEQGEKEEAEQEADE